MVIASLEYKSDQEQTLFVGPLHGDYEVDQEQRTPLRDILKVAREYSNFRSISQDENIAFVTDNPMITAAAITSALKEFGLDGKVQLAGVQDAERWPAFFREVSFQNSEMYIYLGAILNSDPQSNDQSWGGQGAYGHLLPIAETLLTIGRTRERGVGSYPVYFGPNSLRFEEGELQVVKMSRDIIYPIPTGGKYLIKPDQRTTGIQLLVGSCTKYSITELFVEPRSANELSLLVLKINQSKSS